MIFKELYGVLPSAYRKQFQQNLRYSQHQEYQKMELNEKQKQLLMQLIEEQRQIIYEDARILVWKEENMVCCQAKNGWVSIETKAEGRFLLHLTEP